MSIIIQIKTNEKIDEVEKLETLQRVFVKLLTRLFPRPENVEQMQERFHRAFIR